MWASEMDFLKEIKTERFKILLEDLHHKTII
jgi:hypothetical protein